MKQILAVLALFLGGVFNAQAAGPVWDVSICAGCTTPEQFEAAGKQVAGTSFNGERTILVINPETAVSRYVLVFNVPRGQVPLSTRPPVYIKRGRVVELDHNPDATTYFAEDLSKKRSIGSMVITAGNSASSSPVSSGEQQEISALVEFGRKDFIMVLPDNDLFSSFQGRNEPAVANAIYSAMTQKNPGWALQQVGSTLRNLILNRIAVFAGKSFQVCAVFNNGDSACFRPDVATPSLEHLISGSAKDINGNPLAGAGNGLTVERDGPNVSYGPPNTTGFKGAELWCATHNNSIVNCWYQYP